MATRALPYIALGTFIVAGVGAAITAGFLTQATITAYGGNKTKDQALAVITIILIIIVVVAAIVAYFTKPSLIPRFG